MIKGMIGDKEKINKLVESCAEKLSKLNGRF
jgi:hypothetical protein